MDLVMGFCVGIAILYVASHGFILLRSRGLNGARW